MSPGHQRVGHELQPPVRADLPEQRLPTDIPRPQLKVTNLAGFSNGFGPIVGTVIDTQVWGADFGIIK